MWHGPFLGRKFIKLIIIIRPLIFLKIDRTSSFYDGSWINLYEFVFLDTYVTYGMCHSFKLNVSYYHHHINNLEKDQKDADFWAANLINWRSTLIYAVLWLVPYDDMHLININSSTYSIEDQHTYVYNIMSSSPSIH